MESMSCTHDAALKLFQSCIMLTLQSSQAVGWSCKAAWRIFAAFYRRLQGSKDDAEGSAYLTPGVYDVGTVMPATKMESLAQNMGVGQMVLLSAEMERHCNPNSQAKHQGKRRGPSIHARGSKAVGWHMLKEEYPPCQQIPDIAGI